MVGTGVGTVDRYHSQIQQYGTVYSTKGGLQNKWTFHGRFWPPMFCNNHTTVEALLWLSLKIISKSCLVCIFSIVPHLAIENEWIECKRHEKKQKMIGKKIFIMFTIQKLLIASHSGFSQYCAVHTPTSWTIGNRGRIFLIAIVADKSWLFTRVRWYILNDYFGRSNIMGTTQSWKLSFLQSRVHSDIMLGLHFCLCASTDYWEINRRIVNC